LLLVCVVCGPNRERKIRMRIPCVDTQLMLAHGNQTENFMRLLAGTSAVPEGFVDML
jgi:hypothetical protein